MFRHEVPWKSSCSHWDEIHFESCVWDQGQLPPVWCNAYALSANVCCLLTECICSVYKGWCECGCVYVWLTIYLYPTSQTLDRHSVYTWQWMTKSHLSPSGGERIFWSWLLSDSRYCRWKSFHNKSKSLHKPFQMIACRMSRLLYEMSNWSHMLCMMRILTVAFSWTFTILSFHDLRVNQLSEMLKTYLRLTGRESCSCYSRPIMHVPWP